MRRLFFGLAVGLGMGGWSVAASAVDLEAMVGSWSWNGYTVKVTRGGPHGLSARVVEGPRNVGMEMIRSDVRNQADFAVAEIRLPGDGQDYLSEITPEGPDAWHLEGCSDRGGCVDRVYRRAE